VSVYCARCKDRRECGADPKRFADCNDIPQPVEDVFVTLTRAACPAHENYTCVLHETCTATGPNVCPWF
jgi:hypothetical protein